MQPKPKLPGAKPLGGKSPLGAGPRPATARPAGAPGARPAAPRPYGAAPGAAAPGKAKGPRALNYIFLGGAAAMVLGFILPWFSVSAGPISLSWGGWELPIQFNKLLRPFLDLADKVMEPGDPERAKVDAMRTALSSLYAVYLIPLLCGAGVVEELTAFKKGRNWWWMRAIAAASPVIAFLVVLIAFGALVAAVGGGGGGESSGPASSSSGSGGPSAFSVLGFGVYVSFAGFVAAVVGIFIAPKPKDVQAATGLPARPARPPMGAQRTGGNTSVRMAPSVRMKQQAGPVPQPEAAAGLPQADTGRAPQGQAPQEPPPMTPKYAAILLLQLAASIEPEHAPARLQKAAAAAGKLLGEGAAAQIAQTMAAPAEIQDFAAQVADLAGHVSGNAKLAQGVVKCASYALKGADGSMSEAAMGVLGEFENHFGAAVAPAPAPMPAPPAYAPAPPPMPAPPPVYAPAPPPMGQAPGLALPRQRKRRPF